MGTPFIFWINEEPIRQHVSKHSRAAVVAEKIGEGIFRLVTERKMRALVFEGTSGVFCADKQMKDSFSLGLPLPEWTFFLWTGSKLESLPYMTTVKFDDLCRAVDQSTVPAQVLGYAQGIPHAVASVYWIYDSFARNMAYMARDEWPCIEMGQAVLSLMLDGETQVTVRNHHPGICRACSFVNHQSAALAWGENWLGCLAQVPDEGRSRLREILAAR